MLKVGGAFHKNSVYAEKQSTLLVSKIYPSHRLLAFKFNLQVGRGLGSFWAPRPNIGNFPGARGISVSLGPPQNMFP